jgi:hypothetical protein
MYGNLTVTGNSTLNNTTILSSLTISGITNLQNNLNVSGSTIISGNLYVTGNSILNTTTIMSSLNIVGNSVYNNSLLIAGNTTINSTLLINNGGDMIISGNPTTFITALSQLSSLSALSTTLTSSYPYSNYIPTYIAVSPNNNLMTNGSFNLSGNFTFEGWIGGFYNDLKTGPQPVILKIGNATTTVISFSFIQDTNSNIQTLIQIGGQTFYSPTSISSNNPYLYNNVHFHYVMISGTTNNTINNNLIINCNGVALTKNSQNTNYSTTANIPSCSPCYVYFNTLQYPSYLCNLVLYNTLYISQGFGVGYGDPRTFYAVFPNINNNFDSLSSSNVLFYMNKISLSNTTSNNLNGIINVTGSTNMLSSVYQQGLTI